MKQLPLFPDIHDAGGLIRLAWPTDSKITALFSDCRTWRYELSEIWDPDGWIVLWIMMNPSIADIDYRDMTIGRTGAISRYLGAGGQIITNVHAYRATDNKRLLTVEDPCGPLNLETILKAGARCKIRIMAYGKPPSPKLQAAGPILARKVQDACGPLHVLKLSLDGTPMHPLARGRNFISPETTPFLWSPPAEIAA